MDGADAPSRKSNQNYISPVRKPHLVLAMIAAYFYVGSLR